LTALQKLSRGVPSDQCRELISRFSTSRNEDLQQRCYELAGTCTRLNSNLSFKDNLSLTSNYNFLENYVQDQLLQGAKPYNSEQNRRILGYSTGKPRDEYKASEALQSMRIEAYSNPVEKPSLRPVEKNSDQPELHVKKQVWSSDGYKGESSVSAHVHSTQGVVEEAKVLERNKEVFFQPKTSYVPKPPARNEKDVARDVLAQKLFGTFSPGDKPIVPANPSLAPSNPQRDLKKQVDNLLDL